MSAPLIVVFSTVLIDLIGFGIVIPLIGLYGRHFGASATQLALLGGIYSLLQFFFAPLWGALSDRIGRRPVLLTSIFGLSMSYFAFAFAPSFEWLLISRIIGGICAANISTAQACVADITTRANRAKGMGLIGAAFGIGFTIGPPLGGIASAKLGLAAPGIIAGSLGLLNFILAYFRLPETFTPEKRALIPANRKRSLAPIPFEAIRAIESNGHLLFLYMCYFFVTLAFSNMEQTFSLLFQAKFDLDTREAGLQSGLVLMWAGFLGAVIQGGMIRRLVPKFGEQNLILFGLFAYAFALIIFPYTPTYSLFYLSVLPLTIGSSLINPSLASLTSKAASDTEQGLVLGLSQGLGSLARAIGPMVGMLLFAKDIHFPYWLGCLINVVMFGLMFMHFRSMKRHSTKIGVA